MTQTLTLKDKVKLALAPIAPDMLAVDEILKRELSASQSPKIAEVGNYIIAAGGKRVRPALLMLMAKALGYEGTLHQELGATIEMLHTATLMHDDVVDEGMMRRGRPTANAQWGNNVAVLVGDFMYTRSFQMMIRIGNLDVMRALTDAANTLSEGEVIQMQNAHDPYVNESRYFAVIERKTSVLFEAAAKMAAAITPPCTHEQAQALIEYTKCLGNAFQIVDDILDYSGDPSQSGKNLGADFAEGKVTLPVIYALQSCTPTQREFIEQAIRSGEGDFEKISSIILQTDAIEKCRERALQEVIKGKNALSCLDSCIFKDSLIKFLFFTVERTV